MEHIQELWPETPLTVHLSTQFHTQLNDVEKNLHMVNEEIEPLTPGLDLNRCLSLQLQEQGRSMKGDLSDVA